LQQLFPDSMCAQTSASRFNRGMLLNIGFMEASRRRDHDCYFFHDVDLLPEDGNNIYSCPAQPRHVSAAINTMSYKSVSCAYVYTHHYSLENTPFDCCMSCGCHYSLYNRTYHYENIRL